MRRCFVISPIGETNSIVREHADNVFKYIIKPASDVIGMTASRGDHFKEPGKITDQTYSAIVESDVCVAVLTGHNPNVFYELAFAQAARKPIVALIASDDSIPFDIHDMRCIRYDLKLSNMMEHIFSKELVEHFRALEQSSWIAPVPFGGMLSHPSSLVNVKLRHDVFISHPMFGATNDDQYQLVRKISLGVSDLLCLNGQRCHVPNRSVASREGLLDAGFGFENSVQAIRESKYFMLLYPEPLISTVLVEAGQAIALNKRSIFFVRSRSDLPNGLRHSDKLGYIKIYESLDEQGILGFFKNHGVRAFEPW